jgi:hypothetical protein
LPVRGEEAPNVLVHIIQQQFTQRVHRPGFFQQNDAGVCDQNELTSGCDVLRGELAATDDSLRG